MDGLMTEATDLILSKNQNLTKDLNEVFKRERRKSSLDITDVSSITLLRKSITKSLKDRTQSEIIDTFTPKRRKSRRRKGSYSEKPKVDVRLLNSEIQTIDNNGKNQNSFTEEQNKLDSPDIVLTNLFTEENSSESTVQSQFELNETKTTEAVINNYNITENNKNDSVQQNSVAIGLKLAQRQFSDKIFENCSTYILTCPEILPERENSLKIIPKGHVGGASEFSNNSRSISDADNVQLADDEQSENAGNGNSSDDQISLKDSFFATVNSDDKISQNCLFSDDTDCSSVSRRSSIFSMPKENKSYVFDCIKSEDEKWYQKSERKLSKKEKKRQKKSKSNDIPVYDCPKCGVSYILSNNASRSTACCLHCDFWKSVEPVFLKREKQPWNTCRIC